MLNAGLMLSEDVATPDGYDIQMQVNHLSQFLLTKFYEFEFKKFNHYKYLL